MASKPKELHETPKASLVEKPKETISPSPHVISKGGQQFCVKNVVTPSVVSKDASTSNQACGTIDSISEIESINEGLSIVGATPPEPLPKSNVAFLPPSPKLPLEDGFSTVSNRNLTMKLIVNPYLKKRPSSNQKIPTKPSVFDKYTLDAAEFKKKTGIAAISDDWSANKIASFIKYNKDVFGTREETLLIRHSQGTTSRNKKQQAKSLAQFFAALEAHPTLHPLALVKPNPAADREQEEAIYEILRGMKTPAKWNILNTAMIIFGKVRR